MVAMGAYWFRWVFGASCDGDFKSSSTMSLMLGTGWRDGEIFKDLDVTVETKIIKRGFT
jgi:hypothetical protein